MGIQDKIIKWWVQNVYSTKMIRYEPGFIVTEFNNQYGNAFQRLVTIPEQFCIEFENLVKNKNILRNIGRELGFNIGYNLGAPTISDSNAKFVNKYAEFSINYATSGWAKETKIKILNLDSGDYSITYDRHVVCRKNGCGLIFTEGIMEGFVSYLFTKNYSITESQCQGRGDKFCEIRIVSNKEEVPEKIYTSKDIQLYKIANKIRQINYSKQSPNDLFNSNIITTIDGLFFLNNNCIFNSPSLFLYLLEEYIENKDLIFKPAFQIGQIITNPKSIQDIIDLFAIFGYGDLLIKKNNDLFTCILNYAPWEPLYENINNHNYFRGILSGMLTKLKSKEIILNNCKMQFTKDNNLSITFT